MYKKNHWNSLPNYTHTLTGFKLVIGWLVKINIYKNTGLMETITANFKQGFWFPFFNLLKKTPNKQH